MADGNGSKRIESPRLSYIVEDHPADTLANCAGIVRFMGCRVHEIGRGGLSFSANDADAVLRILNTVADAIEFERERAGGAA